MGWSCRLQPANRETHQGGHVPFGRPAWILMHSASGWLMDLMLFVFWPGDIEHHREPMPGEHTSTSANRPAVTSGCVVNSRPPPHCRLLTDPRGITSLSARPKCLCASSSYSIHHILHRQLHDSITPITLATHHLSRPTTTRPIASTPQICSLHRLPMAALPQRLAHDVASVPSAQRTLPSSPRLSVRDFL